MLAIALVLVNLLTTDSVPLSLDDIQTRILSGHDIDIKDAPYQVSLEYNSQHSCGGSILSANTILTSYHCFVGDGETIDTLKIRAGSSIPNQGGSLHDLSLVQCHPLVNSYDIAVVFIDPPFELDETRQIINLTTTEPIAGQQVTITGFGNINQYGGKATHLQSVTVPVLDSQQCEREQNAIINRKFNYTITEKLFCTGEVDRGHCFGDSGGPIVFYGEQLGMVSFGDGCGLRAVSTNLADKVLRSWIKDSME